MRTQDKAAETQKATAQRPSRRRLEQLASIWARQTGRKIVIS